MSEIAYTDMFRQLGIERTDLLIQEQTQLVKKLQYAINKLNKAQGGLRANLVVYGNVLRREIKNIEDRGGLETVTVNVESLSHSEIISILKEQPESWFHSDRYGEVYLSYNVTRTAEQNDAAIKAIQDTYQPRIDRTNTEIEGNTKQLQKLHREREKEATLLGEMKRIRNVVFGNSRDK